VKRSAGWVLACWTAAAGLAGCDDVRAVEAADIEPLPSLERPSPEHRLGLPEVEGLWRFAGFEVPPRDSAAIRAGELTLASPGDFRFDTQRLDSVAGQYLRGENAFAFHGEVRRDSTYALVAQDSDGTLRFVAGRMQADTLWMELTSFPSAAAWPSGSRAALVRGDPPAEPFVRLRGGVPFPAEIDTLALDTLGTDTMPPGSVPVSGPEGERPPVVLPPAERPAERPAAPAQPAPARPPVEPAPRPQEPARPPERPRDAPPARPQPADTVRIQPPPEPEPAQPPTPPRVEPTPAEPPPTPMPRDSIRIP
jgi:hypothetical protein